MSMIPDAAPLPDGAPSDGTPVTGELQAIATPPPADSPQPPESARFPFQPQEAPDEPTYSAWGPGYPAPPAPPHIDFTAGTAPGGPRWSRQRWVALAVVAGLIAVLAAGIGIGRAASGGAPSAARTPAVGARAAATVAVAPSAQDQQQTIENVRHSVQPSVVEVTSQGQGQGAIGSGDILTTDGYIVTNDHVVQGFSMFAVTLSSGKTLPAQVVGQDAQDDLAVLKVSITNAQPIAVADSSRVQVGEFAIAVGNPLGLQQSATLGIVSALNRTASEAPQGPASELTGLIQTSAPINPGNSGGALVDLQGQLIGIPTLGVTDQQTGGTADGIGFAIPSNRVKYVANQLIQNGKLTSTGQGFLGIRSEDVTPQLAAANGLSVQSGALVAGFAQDTAGTSPAQAAGLRVGDIIVAVDGQAVASGSDLASALFSKAPGTRVTLTVVRGSSQLTIPVTLGERPTNTQG